MITQRPIVDQFTVLERRIPELRNTSYSDNDENTNYLRTTWQRLSSWSRMIILLLVLTSSISLPVLLAYYKGVLTFSEYNLLKYQEWKTSNSWIELARWTIMADIILIGWIFANYSSQFIPQLIGFLARKSRKILSVVAINGLELTCTIWKYFCYNFLTLMLWLVSLYLFDYPQSLIDASHKTGSYVWGQLPYQFFIDKLLLLLFISSLFLTTEKVIIHLITKEFNQPLYRDRIQKCLYSLWTIAVLRKAATLFNYTHISKHSGNFEKLWTSKDYPYESADLMSIFILEQFVKLGKKSGDRKQTMAKRLFKFLKAPENTELFINDIKPLFVKVEVEKVFAVIDPVGVGNITEAEFVKIIDDVYQERAALIAVLVTNSDVTKRLDNFMLAFVGILIIFCTFPIIGFSPSEALVPLGVSITPTIVACTLMFGETVKSIFAAIIFLFATHPYDVGDRIYMDQGNYFVRRIGLLSTMFERWDGFIVYVPNSVLATKTICNVRRTGMQGQRIEISLPATMTTPMLTELETRLVEFIQNESRDFAAVRACGYELCNLNQIVMIISLRHRLNWQEGYPRSIRHNKFMSCLVNTLNRMGVQYFTTIRCIELVAPDELNNLSVV